MTSARLKDLAIPTGLVGGPFGSSLVSADYTRSGVPVIRGENLNAGKWIGGQFVFVSEDKLAADLARNTARPGDVVFTQRGTLGQVALVPSGMADQFVVSQSQMRLRVDETRALAAFLYYACTAPEFLQQIDDRAIATGVPHINLGILGSLEVPLPPLRIQRAITEVLGALDDKIAANSQLAQAADELCEALFSRFAVCGDTTLAGVAAVNEQSVKPGEGELRYLDISSVAVGSYVWPGLIDWAEAPGRARRLVKPGDTVWSTVRPNRRSHALVLDEGLIGSTGLAVITPTKAGPAFVYQATKTPQFTAYLEGVAEGSAYPAVRADRFLQAPVPDAAPEDRERFESVAHPARLRAHSAAVESRHLANLRDTLLPHLMSGRITVRDAEKQVEEVL